MLDKQLKKTGTILMHNGQIQISGFEADDCICREVCILAMIWAIGELQQEIINDITSPGGSGNVSVDLPRAVHEALGLPDHWEDINDYLQPLLPVSEGVIAPCDVYWSDGTSTYYGHQAAAEEAVKQAPKLTGIKALYYKPKK